MSCSPNYAMMNISALLMAAEYLDRKDKESDHGYASTLPCVRSIPGARSSSFSSSPSSSSSYSSSPLSASSARIDRRRVSRHKQPQGFRSSHNELEKSRRAHMKHCLELLKSVVPLVGDVTKHTTLGLLNSATAMIYALQETEMVQKKTRDQLLREKQQLQWQYDHVRKAGTAPAAAGRQQLEQQRLRAMIGQYRVRPSVSESSESSIGSTESSEYDNDIDVIGSSDEEQVSTDWTGDICGITSQNLVIL